MITKITTIQGDITKLSVDAIVNPSNMLYNIGGVSKAVQDKAGPKLAKECARIIKTRSNETIKPGEALIVYGYNLPARYIIFTSGVYWNGGNANERKILYNCYINSMILATKHGLKTIAFPYISAGADDMPYEMAKDIAEKAMEDFVNSNPAKIDEIILVKYKSD